MLYLFHQNVLTRSGITFELVSHIPKVSVAFAYSPVHYILTCPAISVFAIWKMSNNFQVQVLMTLMISILVITTTSFAVTPVMWIETQRFACTKTGLISRPALDFCLGNNWTVFEQTVKKYFYVMARRHLTILSLGFCLNHPLLRSKCLCKGHLFSPVIGS